MTPFLLSFLLFVTISAPRPQDPASDQAAIYSVVLADVVRSLAIEAGENDRGFALDPFTRSLQELRLWSPGDSTTRLSARVLRALRSSLGELMVCEPLPEQACKGDVRGRVLRLTTITYSHPDSARVLVQLTHARAARDYSVIVPRPLHYTYELVRGSSGWRITRADRAQFDPRTA